MSFHLWITLRSFAASPTSDDGILGVGVFEESRLLAVFLFSLGGVSDFKGISSYFRELD
jgi:hypothetical protein